MNVLSVDVEDYFQVEAFSHLVDRACWEEYPCRVEPNTRRVLELLAECGATATFFLLGWVAERYPALVREIVAAGHEPACHSYWHRLIYRLNAKDFREDTLRAKQVIEQAAGRPVYGYRAPSFSITRNSLWAFQVLAECGFRYDCSVFPIHHDLYGIPQAPRFPFRIATPSGTLVEYPSSTLRLLGQNLPVGGGGYLRILPFWYTRLGLLRARKDRRPLIVYIHPWETDPEQPRLKGGFRSRLRHYTNLKKTCGRLRRLLRSDRFTSFETSALEETARDVVDLAALQ
jgi:polysaccharide deacetylase family protein (PEP-CTERM system associated)